LLTARKQAEASAVPTAPVVAAAQEDSCLVESIQDDIAINKPLQEKFGTVLSAEDVVSSSSSSTAADHDADQEGITQKTRTIPIGTASSNGVQYVPTHRDPFQFVPDDVNNTSNNGKRQSVGERRRSEIIGQHRFEGVDGMHCYFNLKVIFEPYKTGFEESKEFKHNKGELRVCTPAYHVLTNWICIT
jgi:hypothetical protein